LFFYLLQILLICLYYFVLEFVKIEAEDYNGDFYDNPSTSSSDGDSSSCDDVFHSYLEGRGKCMKENRPFRSGRANANSSRGRVGGGGDETYYDRRERNNAAVKRSRDKVNVVSSLLVSVSRRETLDNFFMKI